MILRNKFLIISAIFLLVLFIMMGRTQDRLMIIDEPAEDHVKVRFDDDSPIARSEVLLYSAEDELLFEGKTNEEGILEFESELEPYKITAQDDMYNRAVWEKDKDSTFLNIIPFWVKVLLVLVLVLVILTVIVLAVFAPLILSVLALLAFAPLLFFIHLVAVFFEPFIRE